MSHCYIFICYLFLILISVKTNIITAQVTVINASFEDSPSDATVPQGWHACEELTTPDILPGYWGVYQEPTDGDTYVGIITRSDGSWESFGQRLSSELLQGTCYETAVDLSHSTIYAGHDKPISLQIFLGNNKCDEGQLIYTSPVIKHEDFKTYNIKFNATQNYNYIILKAYYKDGSFSHRGNILIDNLQPITRCHRA